MRIVKELYTKLSEVDIAEIQFDLRSRNEISKLLMSLQYIYCNKKYREQVFKILKKIVPIGINSNKGRPGISL